MGYCIEMTSNNFIIKKDNAEKVIKSIRELAKFKGTMRWIDTKYLLEANDLLEVFEEIRYPLCENDNGDYEIDYFGGEKLGDDYMIFKVIAPYVEDSYIEMLGEDGEKWRWVFKNGECKELYPTVKWE